MNSGDVGSWFPVPDEESLPEDLRKLFAKARERLRFVPNVFRAYAFRPERLRAWFTHFKALHEPTDDLDGADRELIAVVVSSANQCLHCLVAHGAARRGVLVVFVPRANQSLSCRLAVGAARREQLGDPILGERIAFDWRRAG